MFESSDSMYSNTKSRMMSRKKTPEENISSQSVMTNVHQFMADVKAMNQTILVPSRLMDMELCDSNKPIPDLMRAEKDPYEVYSMLNAAKNDLLYGVHAEDPDTEIEPIKSRSRRDTCIDKWATDDTKNDLHNPPSRRESSLSMLSVASSFNSDSSFDDESNEESSHEASSDGTDSAIGADETETAAQNGRLAGVSSVSDVNAQMRVHLLGLKSCLMQLSETANFITEAYREEISK